MLKTVALCLFSLAALSVAAKADTLNINATSTDPAAITGSVSYTTNANGTYSFTGSTVIVGGVSYTFDTVSGGLDTFGGGKGMPSSSYYVLDFTNANGDELHLNFGQDLGVCGSSSTCDTHVNASYLMTAGQTEIDFDSGALETPVANATTVTPEPSSLVLLGTGVLSLAGMARRKYFV